MWIALPNGELVNLDRAERIYSYQVNDKATSEFQVAAMFADGSRRLGSYADAGQVRRVLDHIAASLCGGDRLLEIAGLEHCDPDVAEALPADNSIAADGNP